MELWLCTNYALFYSSKPLTLLELLQKLVELKEEARCKQPLFSINDLMNAFTSLKFLSSIKIFRKVVMISFISSNYSKLACFYLLVKFIKLHSQRPLKLENHEFLIISFKKLKFFCFKTRIVIFVLQFLHTLFLFFILA